VSVEQEVLAAAEALVADYGAGRVDAYFERLDPEAVFIFYTAPRRLESREAYRTTWDRWVAEDGLRVLECKASNQVVQGLGPNAAVLSHDVVTTLATNDGEETVHERESIVFVRRDRGWQVLHEHLSPA
jgi:ketosteroid isomerase-like protein